jgi:gamma-D-glutamyl-L-lysine dipeptidyl-peptidase
MYGICNLSIVPCRAEPSDRSELVTQLLFGDHFKIVAEEKNCVQIEVAFDQYLCWIDKKQFLKVSEETFNELEAFPPALAIDLVQVINNAETGDILPIVLGSSLPLFNGESCNLEGHEYNFEGQVIQAFQNPLKTRIIENAFTYLNAPYLWGGRSPFGIDCSGFTQNCYKMAGFKIPRDASKQAEVGTTLSFVEEAEEGDLAFFDNAEGKIVHVGIVLQDNKIIHASGKVRIDKFDHFGIFNTDINNYSHNLRLLKKMA